MDNLIAIDSSLLILINHYHTAFWDEVFWLITSMKIWIPMYAMILYVLIKQRNGRIIILNIFAVALLILLCDQISTQVFKYGFERLRPTHNPDLENIVILVHNYTGGKYGFVSSHATNTMGITVLLGLLFRNKPFTIFMILWSLIVSYSRIYCGVHFPGDIIGGMILGIIIGVFIYNIYKYIFKKIINIRYSNDVRKEIKNNFYINNINNIIFVGVLTFVFILLASSIFIK